METPVLKDRFDWRDCDVVRFDPGKLGGRATVRDWRMDADGVLINFESGMSVGEIEEEFGVDREAIESILQFAVRKGFATKSRMKVPA